MYLSLSSTSPLVCLAWVALPGTWRSRRHSSQEHLSAQALSSRQGGDTRENTIIGYIVSNRKIHPSQILDVRSLNSVGIGSDHSLVLCKVRLLIQKNRKKDYAVEERLNKELLTDESIKLLYRSRLEGIIKENPLTQKDELNNNWVKLNKYIKS